MRRRGRGWLRSSWDPRASQSAWQGGGLRERKGKRLCSTDSRAAKQTAVLSLSFSSCHGRRPCAPRTVRQGRMSRVWCWAKPRTGPRGLLSLSVLQRLPGERAICGGAGRKGLNCPSLGWKRLGLLYGHGPQAGLDRQRGFLTLGLFQSSLLNPHHRQMLTLFSKPWTIGTMAAPPSAHEKWLLRVRLRGHPPAALLLTLDPGPRDPAWHNCFFRQTR